MTPRQIRRICERKTDRTMQEAIEVAQDLTDRESTPYMAYLCPHHGDEEVWHVGRVNRFEVLPRITIK